MPFVRIHLVAGSRAARRPLFRLYQVGRGKEARMSDHLTPEDFFEVIDRGGGSGPIGQHLLITGEIRPSSPTPTEEAVLRSSSA